MLEEVAALVHWRGGGIEGVVHGEDGAQGLKVELDATQGLLRLLLALGGNQRNGVSSGAHLVICEDGLVLDGQAVLVDAGHIGGCQHRTHAGHRLRLGSVNAADDGVGYASP